MSLAPRGAVVYVRCEPGCPGARVGEKVLCLTQLSGNNYCARAGAPAIGWVYLEIAARRS